MYIKIFIYYSAFLTLFLISCGSKENEVKETETRLSKFQKEVSKSLLEEENYIEAYNKIKSMDTNDYNTYNKKSSPTTIINLWGVVNNDVGNNNKIDADFSANIVVNNASSKDSNKNDEIRYDEILYEYIKVNKAILKKCLGVLVFRHFLI